MINWKSLLSDSRFWAAFVGVVEAILIAFNYNQMTIENVTKIIMANATLITIICASVTVKTSIAVKKNMAEMDKKLNMLK